MSSPVAQSGGKLHSRNPRSQVREGRRRLVYAATTGTVSAVDFTNGLPTGAATVLSGPAVDGQSWQSGDCSSSERQQVRYPAPRQPL